MRSDWEHRVTCLLGTAILVVGSLLVATHPLVQLLFDALPVVGWSSTIMLSGEQLWLAGGTTLLVVVITLTPLFEPQPRRILDTIAVAGQRVVVSILVLAAIGYFDYSYRLPRTTLIALSLLLLVFIPAWFAVVQRRPISTPRRAIIIGNDREQIVQTAQAADVSIIGYVAPLGQVWDQEPGQRVSFVADGGRAVGPNANPPDYLGNLSQLGSIFIEHGIDTAVLAFARPDRAEFFETLSTCREYGVEAKAHRTHSDSVLTIGASSTDTSETVDIELEPLNWYDHVLKRAFDVVFSATGLVMLAPVIVLIAAVIRLDDSGPVLYNQERTGTFGKRFEIQKFRTMVPNSEDATPIDDRENDRITRVGRLLRRTHLDEIPQLWSILAGKMSVVGPRAVWTDEEAHIEAEHSEWRKRWFIKPGLTGLAQVNDVTSTDPDEKLRYDVLYIREQSFWFDLKIVVRQIWMALTGR